MKRFVLRCPRGLHLLGHPGGPATSGGSYASGGDLCREGRTFPRRRYLQGIHTKAIKEASPPEGEVDDRVMNQNSETIIQRYREFIEARRGEGKGNVGCSSRREMYDPLGCLSEVERKVESEVSTETVTQMAAERAFDRMKDTASHRMNQAGADMVEKSTGKTSVEGMDQKYVILKKQISKEFIHQVFLPHVESQIMYHLKTYTPNQIVNIFHIYSYLYYYDQKKEMVNALLDYLQYRLDCFSVHDVLLVLEPLYLLNRTNNFNIYRLIINHLERIKEKMNLYNYIGVSRVFTKILIDLTFEEKELRGKNILSRLWYHLKQRKFKKDIPPEQRKISHWDFLVGFMSHVVDHVEGQLRLLSAIELTDLLSVMANYSFRSGHSKYDVALLGSGQEREVKSGSGIESAECGENEQSTQNGNQSFQHTPLKVHALNNQNAFLFKENIVSFLIVNELKSKYQELSALHKITNLHNLTKLFIYDEQYLQMIEDDLSNYHYTSNIHHKYLSLLVWCLFKYRRLDKHMFQLKPVVLHNVHYFDAKDLSRLCHAIHDDKQTLINIANNLTNQIEKMPVNDFLCYLYAVVCLDLLPYAQGAALAKDTHHGEGEDTSKEKNNSRERRNMSVQMDNHTLSVFNKTTILQKCTKYINEKKKSLGKNEITKIVLLLKRKKGDKYLYVLDLLPEEWKGILHLIN
ncbi:conserved Plasmodium protein, unknown function [Plasmodium knowlesi strain H]|uniref:Uncharacterized protein n=3 Tax=Plasmodium knowlesi TaxID=5850 RepID=A0A5K1VQ56_PLAKH|nr:conserved protein, unknown function [Plasmodium knowlesi strain H]OTN66460.1 Uncharacterized protein PKNOH_S09514800 [Plasmodium knowlesi]CAA9986321.1 conserved protein, unknown function [Plasmodium knowlesi strain H]SBO25560.1 conserved Plasmodium protein, unknown function [Plasmodium knowlesi strain H]SBO28304.1 conserved Plasmodium protein, unknown function [Plasmodium knowlesi strain H]VVS75795.1 conserved protein, unknown function [Plasmodium knowlesi strain H]|eukprot:XP_002257726.1 hypothetical protein, conserved in Plasmodium species [Plasmodium knowlesi strain H]